VPQTLMVVVWDAVWVSEWWAVTLRTVGVCESVGDIDFGVDWEIDNVDVSVVLCGL
jgi:hypothetical protein